MNDMSTPSKLLSAAGRNAPEADLS
jgi:hypothetical protein